MRVPNVKVKISLNNFLIRSLSKLPNTLFVFFRQICDEFHSRDYHVTSGQSKGIQLKGGTHDQPYSTPPFRMGPTVHTLTPLFYRHVSLLDSISNVPSLSRSLSRTVFSGNLDSAESLKTEKIFETKNNTRKHSIQNFPNFAGTAICFTFNPHVIASDEHRLYCLSLSRDWFPFLRENENFPSLFVGFRRRAGDGDLLVSFPFRFTFVFVAFVLILFFVGCLTSKEAREFCYFFFVGWRLSAQFYPGVLGGENEVDFVFG